MASPSPLGVKTKDGRVLYNSKSLKMYRGRQTGAQVQYVTNLKNGTNNGMFGLFLWLRVQSLVLSNAYYIKAVCLFLSLRQATIFDTNISQFGYTEFVYIISLYRLLIMLL